MKYEIMNPSDKCFIESDDPKIATAAVIFLGRFAYGTQDDKGHPYPSLFIFGGDPDKAWEKEFGITFSAFMEQEGIRKKIGECLKTFKYASDPTSLNDIGAAAERISNDLKGD